MRKRKTEPTVKKAMGKLGPWRDIGNGWMCRNDRDGNGEQAPAKEVAVDVLKQLVNAVAMNCGEEEITQAYGKDIAYQVGEARRVLEVLEK